METMPTNEGREISEARRKLLAFEREGMYVFHGSPAADIEELEPRQAHNAPRGKRNPGKDDVVPDGGPAVVASLYADIAIFRALMKIGRTSFGSDGEGNLTFEAGQETLDGAKDRIGYVYVLPKEGFQPKSGHMKAMDWRNEKPIKPVEVIRVTYEDLPDNIQLIEE